MPTATTFLLLGTLVGLSVGAIIYALGIDEPLYAYAREGLIPKSEWGALYIPMPVICDCHCDCDCPREDICP